MNEHPFPNSDKLYILPCIHKNKLLEVWTKIYQEDLPLVSNAVDVSKKMNNSLANMHRGPNE